MPLSRDPSPRRRSFGFLELDSFIDSSVYSFVERLGAAWRVFSEFMQRFRVRGIKRALVEIGCESLTWGTAGAIVLLAFALPAFEASQKDWRADVNLSVVFLDRAGNEIGRRGFFQNDLVSLSEMPDYLIKAVLATEDRRFFDHFGIDPIGTARAIVQNARRRDVVQGGSTITQQLAKNLFLSNERSIERKIKEAYLALWLEANLTKEEILTLYLTRAYMGGGSLGVGGAAEFYFGKSVKDLTLAESAMLAGLFKAPTKYAPHVNLPAARARAGQVLSNMVDAGFLSEGQTLAARRTPAAPIARSRLVEAPDYFLDVAFEEVKSLGLSGSTFVVVTTIDLDVQKKAVEAIENAIRQNGEEQHFSQGAAVVLGLDGSVRAMVGGRDYGQSQFNRAINAARQPGSSFKPFVYVAALLKGYTPERIVVDQPICIGRGPQAWCPKNYTPKFAGRMTLTTALAKSINSVPVQLGSEIGRDRVAEIAESMGIKMPPKPDWSFLLGSLEVTVIDMASAYTVFANGGRKVEPWTVDVVMNPNGNVVWEHKDKVEAPKQILPPAKVAEMNRMLRRVVEDGTGWRARIDGVPTAGKTGTTQAYRDAWFVGFTGDFAAAVWIGNDDYSSMDRVTGGLIPAGIWQEILAEAHRKLPAAHPIFGVDPKSPFDKPNPGRPPPAATPPTVAAAPQPESDTKAAEQPISPIVAAVRAKRALESAPGQPSGSKALAPRAAALLSDLARRMAAARAAAEAALPGREPLASAAPSDLQPASPVDPTPSRAPPYRPPPS